MHKSSKITRCVRLERCYNRGMGPFDFDQDDAMQPVYCLGCRQQIARVWSNAHQGLCPGCQFKAQQAAQQAQNDDLRAKIHYQLARDGYKRDGKACPHCGGTDFWTKRIKDSNSAIRSAGLLAGCCLWPLLLLALVPDRTVGFSHHCVDCGKATPI